MRALILVLIYVLAGNIVVAQEEPFKRRYVNHTELGGLFGRVKYNLGGTTNVVESKNSLTAQMFNGMQLNNRLSVGGTVGVDWYKTVLINPIAAGARFDLVGRKNARLYATGDVGYGFGWFQQDSDGFNTKGGWMINPGIGMRYGKPEGNAFTIGISYKRQEVHVDKPLQWEQTIRYEDRVYNRLVIRLGMSF
ncbi:hypothetical protein [Dyadobacter sp. CY312]|uniref:hypothetical protein n=1 Tax=Dyadobacter sp. CY312 TaxID=2907303 RepID=UPI001F2E8AE8|nr:hypothetical protein [Dyadobacter sp. CY312]MCE7042130.1 hypothetical protein [Dyadobacter sp. CY312]